jgi:hypothetical protein
MSILKSGGSPPFYPSPGHVIVGRSWQVLAGPGGSFWWVPTWGPATLDPPLWGGGAAWVAILLAFPHTGKYSFCLVLLNYMTSRLYSCCYILLLTQSFFLV